MPVFFDLSSADKIISQTESACLSASGSCAKEPGLSPLFRWMETNVPLLYANQLIGIIHGDIHASNLVREDGALRYILDWQRPMLAPLALEQAIALRLAGYESEDKDWQNLASICQILWFAWAHAHVLPIEGVRQSMWKLISDFSDGL